MDICHWRTLADTHYRLITNFNVAVAYDFLALPFALARPFGALLRQGGC